MALPKVYELTLEQTIADVPAEYDYAVDYRFENDNYGAPVYYKRVDGNFVKMEN